MQHEIHKVDFCIIGGGLAGMCAAIAAARHGAQVALMQERPVLGGNASSEIRMWVCGAHGDNNRETGIIEEIMLESRYRNSQRNFSIWDSILYEKVRFEPPSQKGNITLLLNCTCTDATLDGDRIVTVKGWQLTTQTWHTVEADLFADCSGDSILAALTGAEVRTGREARAEFDEDIEPEQADHKTMGMSCLIQAREMDSPQSFIPPAWANIYATDDDLPFRDHSLPDANFWWIELGGEQDSIRDTETIRDELLKVAFGVWDHIKNRGDPGGDDHGADNWALEWVGFLPGKRESRRYVGDHILTQNDVRAEGRFDDLVAYGGWTMDDHHPGGVAWKGEPTIFHPAPSPFGIPYRCLYSRSVANLFCAGRNVSVTHAAMSATRVMATCALLGQAVGTAAAIAAREGTTPRGVYERHIVELKQMLMDDDCYLPWNVRTVPALARNATLTASEGDPEPLRNGLDRPIGDADNGWTGSLGAWVEYRFAAPERVRQLRFIFDSDLNRPEKATPANYPLHSEPVGVPKTLVRAFRVEAVGDDGAWYTIAHVENNYQRLVRLNVDVTTRAIRFIPESTWGAEQVHVFAWDVA